MYKQFKNKIDILFLICLKYKMDSDSDFSFPSDEIPIPEFFDEESPPNSPKNELSFCSQVYPLSFFYGYDELKYKEYSNKILLPQHILETVTQKDVEFPLFFFIEKNDKKIYFGVEKFLPDISEFYVPNYIFEQLGIEYGGYEDLKIEYKSLPKGTKIVLEPHDKEFLNVPNPKVYLETHILKNYNCLSQDSTIRILYLKGFIDFNVKKVEPEIHVSTIDTDLEVDFEKPLNYIEPPPPPEKKPYNPKPLNDKKEFVPFSGKGNRLGSS
jgi:ubiquitin fusion degradation protein 1